MATRRNFRSLNSREREAFVQAVLALKDNNRRGNAYDKYVIWHLQASVYPPETSDVISAAHRGPAFNPWHREFLRRFELDLQRITGNSDIGIPYWDWTQDARRPNRSPIWALDFMGSNGSGNNNVVARGPFRYRTPNPVWVVVDINGNPARYLNGQATGALKRRWTSGSLFPRSARVEVNDALDEESYDDDPWDASTASDPSHRNTLEGNIPDDQSHLHNRVHVWVGGTMASMGSPADPVFFLHHCNVDRLWAQWQAGHPDAGYLPTRGGPAGHNLNDRMYPWNSRTTPSSVLNHRNLGYTYDTES